MILPSLLAALLAAAPLAPQAPPKSAGDPPPGAVMLIDGAPVSQGDFALWLIAAVGEPAALEYARDAWLLDKAATERGVVVEDAEVRSVLDEQIAIRIQNAFVGNKEEWLDELRRTHRSEGGVRSQRMVELRAEVLGKKLAALDRIVPEELVVREWQLVHGRGGLAYELALMQFRSEFPTPPPGTSIEQQEAIRQQAMEKPRQRALAGRARLLAGEDFSALAAELSEDPETRASRGRVEGRFSHTGWPNSFLDTVDQVPVGEVSDPLYARGGWWLVKVLSRTETPLESVRAPITAKLVARGPESYEIGAYVDGLAKDLEVRLAPGILDPAPSLEGPGGDVVALLINGQPVPRGPFALWLRNTRGEAMADTYAEHYLVRKRAKELGIAVAPEELRERQDDYIRRLIESSFKGKRETLLAKLAFEGRTEDSFLFNLAVRLETDMMVEKIMLSERTVTPEMVHRRWEERFGPNGRGIHARAILLLPATRIPPEASPEERRRLSEEARENSRKEGEAIVAQARGGADFGALARQHSQDPETRAKGGELDGVFTPAEWDSSIAEPVMALEQGQITEPLAFRGGWAVFEAHSVRNTPLEEVRAELESLLAKEPPPETDLAVYRNALLKQSQVEVLPAMYE